ncbi:MAG: hypothetical protein MN733_05165 [Nitrososphaera sp.]|nr:hypothetical protein [Nitrososphaera sp.]
MAIYVTDPSIGYSSTFNITAPAVIKTGQGLIATVSVIVAGSAAGAVHDVATTGAAAVSNQIAAIPNAIGLVPLRWGVTNGIVIVPGTGQTLAISWS